MASRKENLKSLFKNTRSKTIIIIVAVTLVIALTVGIVSFRQQTGIPSAGSLRSNLGGVSSTPGALNQSPEYAKLQNEQNVQNAAKALNQGTSAIPTIIDLKSLGDGVTTIGPQGGRGSVGFQTLATTQNIGQKQLWLQDLSNSQCDQKSYNEAIRNNASLSDLKQACSCPKLKSYGYELAKLIGVCSCQELREAGTSAIELKKLGYDVEKLKNCGFSACDLKSAGFSASDLKNAGYTDAELAGLGYSPNEIASSSGLPLGVTALDIKKLGCSPEALSRLKAQGVSAGAVRRISGCDAVALKNAGYTLADFKNAGFAPAELKTAGYSATDLKQVGVSPKDLIDAGYSPQDLEKAGIDADAIKAALMSLPPGISDADLKAMGCSPEGLAKAKAAGISAAAIVKINGCSAAALKAAGYSDDTLSAAGISPAEEQIKQITPEDVRKQGCSAEVIKREIAQGISAAAIVRYAGCNQADLKAAGLKDDEIQKAIGQGLGGCEIQPILNAGCDAAKLAKLGVSVAKITAINHCPATVLKSAGFKLSDILAAGFSQSDLVAAGYSNADIVIAFEQNAETKNVSDADITKAQCLPLMLGNLRRQGISAARIKASNQCQISAFKAACFSPGAMISAGFTPDELQKVGIQQIEVQQAQNVLQNSPNISDQLIKDAGCDVNKLTELRNLGVLLAKIQSLNHCEAKAVEAAGYCLSDLLSAGLSPKDIGAMGIKSSDIQQAQNNLAELLSNQCPPEAAIPLPAAPSPSSDTAIKASGCDPQKLAELRSAGVTAEKIVQENKCSLADLKAAGFSPQELMKAGFSAKDLANSGISSQDIDAGLRNPLTALADARTSQCSLSAAKQALEAGVSPDNLRKNLGCSATILTQAGFKPADLKAAGYTAGELAKSGVPLSDLLKAGFASGDLKDAGFSANDLLAQGVKPTDLADAGFSSADLTTAGLGPKELLAAGVKPELLKKIGYSADDLKKAGLNASQLAAAGFPEQSLKDAGFSDTQIANPAPSDQIQPSSAKVAELQQQLLSNIAKAPTSNAQKTAEQGFQNLNKAMDEQKKMQTAMKFQQKIQQKTSLLLSYATQLVNGWKQTGTQIYVAGTPKTDKLAMLGSNVTQVTNINNPVLGPPADISGDEPEVFIKSGDILFAVIDTAVNTDEPSPILATITNGPLRGAKLIGSFNLPGNADKTIITFTTLSIQGLNKTTGISAYAIDPNTGRTALSSSTNHHYLMRYGALFASTFIQGFGNAFQSADTTITIGGTGGTGGPNTTTVQNGIGRSLTSNAVIGLATLGQSWAQQAQQNMAVPTTVQVYSGTPIGVLFIQDVSVQTMQTK